MANTDKRIDELSNLSSLTGDELVLLQDPTTLEYGKTTLANVSAKSPVTSVAGKTGAVSLTKDDVGLSNAENTADVNKPISSATQAALNSKEGTINPGNTGQYFRGDKTWQTLDKSDVGLGNAENTSDLSKPISTATQTALDTKATTTALDAHTSSTANPHNVTKEQVGLGATDNVQFKQITAGTTTDVLGTALTVIRNNVAVGRIDNNASGLRVQAQSGTLQLRGTGNTGLAIDASGNTVGAGTITATNLSGTNTGDQPLGSRTITGTANQITVTNGDGVSGNPTLSLPQNIHTGASPTFGSVTVTDDAYASGWNGSSVVPTKNAVYDKIEALNADKTSIDYIASRGPSLVTNGQALLGNNYNFSLYTLDKTDKPTGAAGSFVAPVGAAATNLDEFMAINPARIYEMSFAVRQAAGDGARVFYSYLAPYDIDKLPIAPNHYMEQAGTRTTLAAPLNPGDTTITLTSSANWNNAAGSLFYLRTIIVWNYVDGQGYAWPVGTYSRNSRINSYNDGAISGNVITLSTPWNLPAAPAGTAISNGSSGGSYMYGAQAVLGPSTWTNYAYKYSGIHSNNAAPATTSFPIATAYVKAGFLRNYPTSPVDPTSIQKFANVALVDITEANNKLPLAGGTMTGTLVLPNSVLASSGQISSSMSIGLAFSQSRGGQIRSWGVTSAGEFGIWNDTTAQLMLNVLNDRILLGGSTGIIRGTGFPEGVVTANVGSIYIDTAITNGASSWIKKSGSGNTGWQVLEGDTGWRKVVGWTSAGVITGTMPTNLNPVTGVAGGVFMRRVGSTVQFSVVAGVTTSTSVAGAIPDGFSGGQVPYPQVPISATSSGGSLVVRTLHAGLVTWTLSSITSGDQFAGGGSAYGSTASWLTTQGWPTTLPGVSA